MHDLGLSYLSLVLGCGEPTVAGVNSYHFCSLPFLTWPLGGTLLHGGGVFRTWMLDYLSGGLNEYFQTIQGIINLKNGIVDHLEK